MLVPTVAFGTENSDDPCNAQGGGVTAGYLCAAQKTKAADDQLNIEYKKPLKESKKKSLPYAKPGQALSWLAYSALLKELG